MNLLVHPWQRGGKKSKSVHSNMAIARTMEANGSSIQSIRVQDGERYAITLMTVAQSEKVPVVAELKNEGPAISSLHRDEVIFTYNKRPTRASRGFRLQSMCCGTVVVYRSIVITGGCTYATPRREF
jgi:hypothetical protein